MDTGSDITVVGTDLVKNMRCKVHPTHLSSVKTTTVELVLLTGVIKEDLIAGGLSVRSLQHQNSLAAEVHGHEDPSH